MSSIYIRFTNNDVYMYEQSSNYLCINTYFQYTGSTRPDILHKTKILYTTALTYIHGASWSPIF